MLLRGSMQVNAQGHLVIGGCDTVELAEKYGTPLWVMDEELLRETCRRYREAFILKYGAEVLYAGKAFLTLAMASIVAQEGLGLDVVSGGELYTALQAGFPEERIYFHGNNKNEAELTMALEAGVGRIVVDNFTELEKLAGLAQHRRQQVNILLRLTPGVEAHTHEYIKTGQIDSKFGFTLPNGQAQEAVLRALDYAQLNLVGLHCHIGSQIFELDSYRHAAEVMIGFLAWVKRETGREVQELDLGGGFGIYYAGNDQPAQIEDYANLVHQAIVECCRKENLQPPRVVVEPGRSIAGPAGTSLYRVGSIKEIPGVRKYVAVDGGMADNIRPALYQARYEVATANKMNQGVEDKVTVTGKCCESGDMLAWDVDLPPLKPGDLLAMPATGAYGYTMSSNYNRLGRPAVVLAGKGQADLIVRRESYEDLLRNDLLPDRLRG